MSDKYGLAPLLDQAGFIGRIDWQPGNCSASFHGRDWFAPVAARLATGQLAELTTISPGDCVAYPARGELQQVIYIDHFGNVMTGVAASSLASGQKVRVGARVLQWARTFSDVPQGEVFCYPNSLGLVEIAVNQGHAADRLQLALGDPVAVI